MSDDGGFLAACCGICYTPLKVWSGFHPSRRGVTKVRPPVQTSDGGFRAHRMGGLDTFGAKCCSCCGSGQAGCCGSCCGDSFNEDAFDKQVKKDLAKTRATEEELAKTTQPTAAPSMTIPKESTESASRCLARAILDYVTCNSIDTRTLQDTSRGYFHYPPHIYLNFMQASCDTGRMGHVTALEGQHRRSSPSASRTG
ncbi:hypothetical protein Hypma_009490 [Hypsizygus marmoreus]|uniref:Uncharacterized protein n=1 Tax=Hypsizygus marmoreus TaxID=39966 RepID=A0A369JVT6_HYPMA|nr:hypothetical protein Hypma_009490 [Hypsizygus marmoreus]